MDLNDDGNIDLLGESYAGLTYVLYGNKDGSFNEAIVLQDKSGTDIHIGMYYDFKANKYVTPGKEKNADKGVFVKAHDWDNDGDLDLLISGNQGIYLRINEGTKTKFVFETKNTKVLSSHYADAIVDWDGDGLWDILGGSYQSGVYLYRNTGTLKHPSFEEAKCLLEPAQLLKKTNGVECGNSNIAVADYNNDGKLDVLIGVGISEKAKPLKQLSPEQIKEKESLQKEHEKLLKGLIKIEKKIEEKFNNPKDQESVRKMHKALRNNKKLSKLYREIHYIDTKLLKEYPTKTTTHAYIMLSLRK